MAKSIDNIDPELRYCPACGDEYRSDIVSCAGCDRTLIDGAVLLAEEQANGSEDEPAVIGADDTLVAVQTGSLFDMKNIKNLLARHGVPAVLVSEENCAGGGCGGARIIAQIREQDVGKAAGILGREHARTTAIEDYAEVSAEAVFDPEAARVNCPACGHEFTPEGSDCPECGLCFL